MIGLWRSVSLLDVFTMLNIMWKSILSSILLFLINKMFSHLFPLLKFVIVDNLFVDFFYFDLLMNGSFSKCFWDFTGVLLLLVPFPNASSTEYLLYIWALLSCSTFMFYFSFFLFWDISWRSHVFFFLKAYHWMLVMTGSFIFGLVHW